MIEHTMLCVIERHVLVNKSFLDCYSWLTIRHAIERHVLIKKCFVVCDVNRWGVDCHDGSLSLTGHGVGMLMTCLFGLCPDRPFPIVWVRWLGRPDPILLSSRTNFILVSHFTIKSAKKIRLLLVINNEACNWTSNNIFLDYYSPLMTRHKIERQIIYEEEEEVKTAIASFYKWLVSKSLPSTPSSHQDRFHHAHPSRLHPSSVCTAHTPTC